MTDRKTLIQFAKDDYEEAHRLCIDGKVKSSASRLQSAFKNMFGEEVIIKPAIADITVYLKLFEQKMQEEDVR